MVDRIGERTTRVDPSDAELEVWYEKSHPPPGSRPGTYVAHGLARPTTTELLTYGTGDTESVADADVDDVRRRLAGDGRKAWVSVSGLGDTGRIAELADLFALHPLVVEDIIHTPHRPSFQSFEQHFVVIGATVDPQSRPGSLHLEQVGLVCTDHVLLSVKEHRNELFASVRQRIEQPDSRVRSNGPDYLCYALLDAVIDGYFPFLEDLGEELDRLEDDVVFRPQPATLARVNRLKKELLILRRALWPLREAIGQMIRDRPAQLSEEVEIYLRDCSDHCIQLLDLVETARELASSLTSTYLSSIANRTNDVMKVLTIMASIFIPLTFIAGLYGMNFEHMPELRWRWAYPVVLAVMAVLGLGLMAYFRARGWFRNDHH